jgi:uncharacterized repeat protein (TIGR01451 family)
MKNIFKKVTSLVAIAVIFNAIIPVLPTELLPRVEVKTAHAEALCTGISVSVEAFDVTANASLGTFDADASPQFYTLNVPFGHVVEYRGNGGGTPSFTSSIQYDTNDGFSYFVNSYWPDPDPDWSNYYTAPAIYENGSYRYQRTENLCTAQEGFPGDSSASVFITISTSGFNLVCNNTPQTVPAGTTASFAISADTGGAFTSDIDVTMTSDPTGPVATPNPLTLSSPTYAGTIDVATAGLAFGTYTLTFSGTGGGMTDTCDATLQVMQVQPTANIKFDNSDEPVSVSNGATGLISWESLNATSCTATSTPAVAGWGDNNPVTPLSNPHPGGVNVTLSGPQTYTFSISCTNGTSSADDYVQVIVGNPAPSVTLQCQGSGDLVPQNGPCNINYKTAGTLSWSSQGATSCTMTPSIGATITVPTGSGSSGNLTSNTTFTINCTGPGGVASDTVDFNIISNPDFTMACSPASLSVAPGDSTTYLVELGAVDGYSEAITLSGEASGGNGKGDLPTFDFTTNAEIPPYDHSPIVSTTRDTINGTYTLTFTATDGSITKTCDVELLVETDPSPNNPTLVSTSSAGACGTINISWKRGSGGVTPTGFQVYRRASIKSAWEPLGDVVPYSGSIKTTYELPDPAPLSPTSSNYYSVTALYNLAESAKVDATPSPIVPNTCNSDGSLSDKDLIQVSGKIKKTFPAVACSANSETAILPNNALFSPGDVVTFQINVCNSGEAAMTRIQIIDTLSNLTSPDNFSSDSKCLNNAIYDGDKTITFDITDVPAGGTGVQACSVTFTAVVTAPGSTNSSLYRFQNSAKIISNESTRQVYTPPYLFSLTGGVPIRNESAPN